MSRYLVERVRSTPNVEVRLETEVVERRGDGHLEAVTLLDHGDGTEGEVAPNWLFVFIGATPRTDWLGADVARDGQGFVVTGRDLCAHEGERPGGRCPRAAGVRDEHSRCVRGR